MNEDLNHNTQTQFEQPEEKAQPTEVKNNNFLITLLSVLLLLACLIAVFFAYQTQNLVKELSEYRSQNLAKPNLTSPTAKPSPTSSGFHGYSESGKKFTLNLKPECKQDYGIVCTKDDFIVKINPEASGRGSSTTPKVSTQKFGSFTWEKRFFIEDLTTFATYGLTTGDDYYLIEVDFSPYSLESVEYFENILSTFKFVEPQASTEPVACTMDAKICPDGNSVGRIAPNCEFAPCPTQKPN